MEKLPMEAIRNIQAEVAEIRLARDAMAWAVACFNADMEIIVRDAIRPVYAAEERYNTVITRTRRLLDELIELAQEHYANSSDDWWDGDCCAAYMVWI